MEIANFIGPNGYGYDPAQRPRAPRAPNPPTNQGRAARVRLELTLNRAPHLLSAPPILLPPSRITQVIKGPPTPPGIITLPPPEGEPTRPRPGTPGYQEPTPEPETRLTMFIGRNAVAAASTFGGSLPFPFPGDIVEVILSAAVETALGAGSLISGINLTVTPNQTTTSAAALAGTPLFLFTTSATAVNLGEIELPNSVPLHFSTRTPIPLYPGFLNAVFNAAGAGFFTFSVLVVVASGSQERLRTYGITAADVPTLITRAANFPRPPSRGNVPVPGVAGGIPLNQYTKIESLAQNLRQSPFGIPHAQFIAMAAQAGFTDPERAAALAITQAARAPDIKLLAAGLR